MTLLFFLLYPPLGWMLRRRHARGSSISFAIRDRVTPLRPGLVISAADGKISAIEKVTPPAELGLGPGASACAFRRSSSMFDVHINRAPVAGRIVRSLYVPGTFLNAALDKASEDNERRIHRHRDARRTARSAWCRSPGLWRAAS